ncbi:hypothetical protein EYF80_023569 [Liparis tanakae]|uniref:Uncharacterized protein n=1 Tax=Liparis tanakae TaxID=230148 RepID=A0A4Z2HL06_9TELE|nr:hypothetical protein EYF80_023569 [Liparis tanakae]
MCASLAEGLQQMEGKRGKMEEEECFEGMLVYSDRRNQLKNPPSQTSHRVAKLFRNVKTNMEVGSHDKQAFHPPGSCLSKTKQGLGLGKEFEEQAEAHTD